MYQAKFFWKFQKFENSKRLVYKAQTYIFKTPTKIEFIPSVNEFMTIEGIFLYYFFIIFAIIYGDKYVWGKVERHEAW